MKQRVLLLGQQKRLKFILVGDSSVGKSSIFWKYIEGEFLSGRQKTVTTIDFRMKNITYNNELVKLYIWDTAGQERYRSIIETYFKGCHGVIMVFDQTSQQSYTNLINKWHPIIQTKAEGAKIILIGNKSDLDCSVNRQSIKQWADNNKIPYYSCSAKNGTNIQQAFDQLIKLSLDSKTEFKADKPFELNTKQKKKKKKCC